MAPESSTESLADERDFVEDDDSDRSRMSFLEHLDELRRRILYSVYAIAACTAVTFYYWDAMFRYLVRYFQAQGGTLIYSQPTAAFMFSLKIALFAGLLISSPFVFAQLWLFIAPGLYAREKKVVIPVAFFCTLLFAAGAWFGHVVAFPSMWRFFSSYQIEGLTYYPQLDVTFSFYTKMIVGLGLVFQMPLLVFFLARFGIVTAGFLVRKFKYAVLIIFILAAVVTPSADVVNQLIFAAPMMVLYGISIVVALIFAKKKPKDD
jgi:sec-independent protein translocase protein TatC